MTNPLRVALVLTGGGARASYQVGVIEELADRGIEVIAVSGVGTGALHASSIAGHATLPEAVGKLKSIWEEMAVATEATLKVGPIPVLRLGAYLTLLFSLGLSPRIHHHLKQAAGSIHRSSLARKLLNLGQAGFNPAELILAARDLIDVSTDTEFQSFVSSTLSDALNVIYRPFFVSVYEHNGSPLQAVRDGLLYLGLLDTSPPIYIDVSDPDISQRDKVLAVMASASLPFLCGPVDFQGRQYVDGSFGGFKRSLGAVPLQPLRRLKTLDADAILVVQTEPGVVWDTSSFSDLPVLEIRPSEIPQGELGFNWATNAALSHWIELGRGDASRVLSELEKILRRQSKHGSARKDLRKSSDWL